MMSTALSLLVVSGVLSVPQQAPGTPAPNERRVDGRFEDWAATDRFRMKVDPAGDAVDAPDITRFVIDSDANAVWFLLEFASPVTLQGLSRPLILAIDSDGRPQTGATKGPLPGADIALVLSPDAARFPQGGILAPSNKPQNSGAGNAERSKGEGTALFALRPDGTIGNAIPHEASHIEIAPTHASRQFEIRMPRLPNGMMGMTTAARLFCAEEVESGGVQLLEDVEVLRVLLAAATIPKDDLGLNADAARAALARAPGSDLRVVSWNAERGRIFEASEGFAATLKLLDPDVVILQELGAKATAESLSTWMRNNVGSSDEKKPWSAVVSGGDLRVGIAARGDLANASFLDGVKRGSPPNDRSVRVHGAAFDNDGNAETPPLLLVSLHLKCCGKLGSSEDTTRSEEAIAIREAILNSAAKNAYAGIVVAGDFNLVGDPAVLAATGRGLDRDGSDLDLVSAFQLDGISTATWRSKGAPFVPGRLDYALVSGATVQVLNSFVFDGRDLTRNAVQALALPSSAIDEPSDHLPIVFDLRVLPPAPASPPTEKTP